MEKEKIFLVNLKSFKVIIVYILLILIFLVNFYYKSLLYNIKNNNKEIFKSEKDFERWVHTFNDLDKFCKNQKNYDGFEIDLQFDKKDNRIYVEHDFNEKHNENNELSHYLKCFNSNGLWLDLKNFDTLKSFEVLENYLIVLDKEEKSKVYIERKFKVLKKLNIAGSKKNSINLMSVFNLKCDIRDIKKMYYIKKYNIKNIIIKNIDSCKKSDMLKYFNVFYFRYVEGANGLSDSFEAKNYVDVGLFDI